MRTFSEQRIWKTIPLSIVEDVKSEGRLWTSTSKRPWLRLDVDAMALSGRWVRLAYMSGLLEPLVRPVLRCKVGDRHLDQVMPGALFGRGIWLGRIPDNTNEIWVSPTNRRGHFSFAIESLQCWSRPQLIYELLRKNPLRALKCVSARACRLRYLAHLHVKRTLCATPLSSYAEWRMLRQRQIDLMAFDAMPPGPGRKPHIRFIVEFVGDAIKGSLAILEQLTAQTYPNWSLLLNAPPTTLSSLANVLSRSQRSHLSAPQGAVWRTISELLDDDLVVRIASNDTGPTLFVGSVGPCGQRNAGC